MAMLGLDGERRSGKDVRAEHVTVSSASPPAHVLLFLLSTETLSISSSDKALIHVVSGDDSDREHREILFGTGGLGQDVGGRGGGHNDY